MMVLLEGSKITKYFGGLCALRNIDFTVGEREIVGLIGPNGSGKTTLFNCISGLYKPDSGRIRFMEKDLTNLKPHTICRLGIARTFQIVRSFMYMTVLENVMVGIVYGRRKVSNLNEAKLEALKYLEFIGLDQKKDVLAKNLTLVERKMLEIARALAVRPKIILLDEAIAGLNPHEVLRMTKLISAIRSKRGISIFWVEHVMRAIMSIADRIIVLHQGEKIAEGTPKEISHDARVTSIYLGKEIDS